LKNGAEFQRRRASESLRRSVRAGQNRKLPSDVSESESGRIFHISILRNLAFRLNHVLTAFARLFTLAGVDG
jgi:hypothetical protein